MTGKTIDDIVREQRESERVLKKFVQIADEITRIKGCLEKHGHHPGEVVSMYLYNGREARCYCSNCDGHYTRDIRHNEMKMMLDCIKLLYPHYNLSRRSLGM